MNWGLVSACLSCLALQLGRLGIDVRHDAEVSSGLYGACDPRVDAKAAGKGMFLAVRTVSELQLRVSVHNDDEV